MRKGCERLKNRQPRKQSKMRGNLAIRRLAGLILLLEMLLIMLLRQVVFRVMLTLLFSSYIQRHSEIFLLWTTSWHILRLWRCRPLQIRVPQHVPAQQRRTAWTLQISQHKPQRQESLSAPVIWKETDLLAAGSVKWT